MRNSSVIKVNVLYLIKSPATVHEMKLTKAIGIMKTLCKTRRTGTGNLEYATSIMIGQKTTRTMENKLHSVEKKPIM